MFCKKIIFELDDYVRLFKLKTDDLALFLSELTELLDRYKSYDKNSKKLIKHLCTSKQRLEATPLTDLKDPRVPAPQITK